MCIKDIFIVNIKIINLKISITFVLKQNDAACLCGCLRLLDRTY